VIQEELTKGLGDRAPRVESHYFENYLNLPLHRSGHLVQAGARMVQHGDFAPVNILRDPARDQWGVIDWDWMGASYPPLFDFFTFFTRVHFLERRRKGLTFHEELMESFVDSFFRPTWFSSVVQEQVIRYCDRFQLSYQDTFDHFIQYLLFQCGKYRHVMPGHPEFHSSYEEILRGSIRSKERFVCQ
jgi:thiamine kinase-like enzyme